MSIPSCLKWSLHKSATQSPSSAPGVALKASRCISWPSLFIVRDMGVSKSRLISATPHTLSGSQVSLGLIFPTCGRQKDTLDCVSKATLALLVSPDGAI